MHNIICSPYLNQQACHACTAVIYTYYGDENVKQYTDDLDRMHKVVLEAKDEDTLRKLSENLKSDDIDHTLWMEQPENIPTCLATKPYPKEHVQKYFKKLKLFK